MNTNNQNIEELVAKYLEGETSLAEEKLLREMLKSNDIPEKFREIAEIFSFAERERDIYPKGKDIESIATAKIKRRNMLRLDTRNGRLGWKITSIAASFIIALAIFFSMGEPTSNGDYSALNFESNIKDPDKAYIETRKAFSKISIKLGLAQKGMNKLEIMDDNINKLNDVSKFDEIRNLIFRRNNSE